MNEVVCCGWVVVLKGVELVMMVVVVMGLLWTGRFPPVVLSVVVMVVWAGGRSGSVRRELGIL